MLHKAPDEIHDFIRDIKQHFSGYIQPYEILFAYKEYKYSFMTEAMRK
jgi:hypothetical protein